MDLQDSYNQAWIFAAGAHAGQTLTASTLPYAVHLAMVANEVMAADREAPIERLAETLQIALLHDVLEDTPCLSRNCRCVSASSSPTAPGI